MSVSIYVSLFSVECLHSPQFDRSLQLGFKAVQAKQMDPFPGHLVGYSHHDDRSRQELFRSPGVSCALRNVRRGLTSWIGKFDIRIFILEFRA